jgi:hypothetical protein
MLLRWVLTVFTERYISVATGPQFHDSAARQHLHSNFRMPGVYFLGQSFDQGFCSPGGCGGGLKIPGTTGKRQPDQRRGEPGRDVVVGKTTFEDALGRGQRGEAGLPDRVGEPRRS